MNWQTTLSGEKRRFLLYSEDQQLSSTRITLPTLLTGRLSEQTSSLDFQMDETSLDTD